VIHNNDAPGISAILFDMDGVLADSELLWNDIDAAMLAEHGVSYSGELKHEVLGKSFPIALNFYRDHFKLSTTVEELMVRRHAIAADFYAHRIGIYPDAQPVLRTLKEGGYKIALATSSISELVLPFLDRHELTPFFDAIITGEQVERGKPNPDIYLLAAGKVGAAPENCLVVEDAVSGTQAGKAAAMRVAAIPDVRFVDPGVFDDLADYVLGNLGELPALVNRLHMTHSR
jgi:HAD superfamily hydrolase (TIGR01509 family)